MKTLHNIYPNSLIEGIATNRSAENAHKLDCVDASKKT